MRIFKNKEFHRWAVDENLTDQELIKAINDINLGSYEANLGGGIYKKRMAIGGKGKSGGVRTIVAFKANNNVFFIYGYAKNVRSNITKREELALKALAKIYFGYSEEQIDCAIKTGQLFEVKDEKVNSRKYT